MGLFEIDAGTAALFDQIRNEAEALQEPEKAFSLGEVERMLLAAGFERQGDDPPGPGSIRQAWKRARSLGDPGEKRSDLVLVRVLDGGPELIVDEGHSPMMMTPEQFERTHRPGKRGRAENNPRQLG